MNQSAALFHKNPERPVKLTIRPDRIRELKRGHPWVYGNSLSSLPDAKPGSFAIVRDSTGNILAKGMYDPSCPIAFRVCALEDSLSDELVERRIDQAIHSRASIISSETTGCRLIYGEGDCLPGLICDQYGTTGVMQTDGEGPANFWNLAEIARVIAKRAKLESIYFKPRSGSDSKGYPLFGSLPTSSVQFLEHGALYETDIINGQKTGFFLDQRENRRLVRSISQGKSILNLFGYTGGFSIAAGLGGASSVVTVDIARPAIHDAEKNWRLNHLAPEQHRGIAQNAFDFLESASQQKELFDFIIVDPPSFVSSQAGFEKGRGAYVSIFSQAASIVSQGGLLALSSCSSQVTSEVFLEICGEAISKSKRRAIVLQVTGQPLDHPFPLACQELRYLKFVLFQLD